MENKIYHVLFICSGNSIRSIFAERIIEQLGAGRFKGYSAGTNPRGEIHPLTLDVLERNGLSGEGLYSKSVDTFYGPDASEMDFIFTVCDRAAQIPCPKWKGQPLNSHWSIADPALENSNEVDKVMAFRSAFRELQIRLEIFVSLPIATLDKLKLQNELDRIEPEAEAAE